MHLWLFSGSNLELLLLVNDSPNSTSLMLHIYIHQTLLWSSYWKIYVVINYISFGSCSQTIQCFLTFLYTRHPMPVRIFHGYTPHFVIFSHYHLYMPDPGACTTLWEMSKTAKKQYLGLLLNQDTKEVLITHLTILSHHLFHKPVPARPIVWFQVDDDGGWKSFILKISLSNLVFDGGIAPASKAAAKDYVGDLVTSCRTRGLEVQDPPTKPVSFSALVKDLQSLGLLGDPVPPPPVLPPVTDPLQVAHKTNVG